MYIGRIHERRELGNPYAVRGERGGGTGEGMGHKLRQHERAVELYTEWLRTGHLRMDAGPGIAVTAQRATRGELQSQREAAIEALADRVRGGEKLMLLCHCVPLPCHGQVLAVEVMRRARDGRSRASELPPELRELYDAWRSEVWDPHTGDAV